MYKHHRDACQRAASAGFGWIEPRRGCSTATCNVCDRDALHGRWCARCAWPRICLALGHSIVCRQAGLPLAQRSAQAHTLGAAGLILQPLGQALVLPMSALAQVDGRGRQPCFFTRGFCHYLSPDACRTDDVPKYSRPLNYRTIVWSTAHHVPKLARQPQYHRHVATGAQHESCLVKRA